jgi:hypothetical protein
MTQQETSSSRGIKRKRRSTAPLERRHRRCPTDGDNDGHGGGASNCGRNQRQKTSRGHLAAALKTKSFLASARLADKTAESANGRVGGSHELDEEQVGHKERQPFLMGRFISGRR